MRKFENPVNMTTLRRVPWEPETRISPCLAGVWWPNHIPHWVSGGPSPMECCNDVCSTFLRGETPTHKIVWGSLRRVPWLPKIRFSVPGNDFVGTSSAIPQPPRDFLVWLRPLYPPQPRLHASAFSTVRGFHDACSGEPGIHT